MSYFELNDSFNEIALEQGVEFGSKDFIRGGIQPFSGTTGGHFAYGWNHEKAFEEYGIEWARQVFANYGSRRLFYHNFDASTLPRQAGYDAGGRPYDYTPTLPGDNPDGSATWFTTNGMVRITGPDIDHFQLSPLFTLARLSEDHVVKIQGRDYPISKVAKVFLNFFLSAQAGMLRSKQGNIANWSGSERGYSLVLGNFAQALEVGIGFESDLDTFARYIEQNIFKFLGTSPGYVPTNKWLDVVIQKTGLPASYKDTHNYYILFNCLYWTLPRLLDLQDVLAGFSLDDETYKYASLCDKIHPILTARSQWMLDLETRYPGQGCAFEGVLIPKDAINSNGGPLTSIAEFIENEKHVYNGLNYELWGMRAQSVAASVLDSDVMREAFQATVERVRERNLLANENQYPKAWFYDGVDNYVGA